MQACLFISCIECSLRLTVVYLIVPPLRSCFLSPSGMLYSSNYFPILYDGTSYRLDGTNDRLDGANDRLDGTSDRLDGTRDRLDGTSDRLGQPARWNE